MSPAASWGARAGAKDFWRFAKSPDQHKVVSEAPSTGPGYFGYRVPRQRNVSCDASRLRVSVLRDQIWVQLRTTIQRQAHCPTGSIHTTSRELGPKTPNYRRNYGSQFPNGCICGPYGCMFQVRVYCEVLGD